MNRHRHIVEARIRYLTADEGGRRTPVGNGYRGQFFYDDNDYDGFQYFPDHENEFVELGQEVRAYVAFLQDRWDRLHRDKLYVGKQFKIREGAKTVGEGVITSIDVPDELVDHLLK